MDCQNRVQLAAFVLLMPGSMALAQQTPDLAVGTRVRVTAPGAGRQQLAGNIVAVDEKALTVIDDGRPVRVPHELITKLDVSWGRKRHVWQGLLVGAAAGGLIGAVLPLCTQDMSGYETCSTRGELITGGVIGFGGVGAMLGALVKSDKWVETPLDGVRIGLRSGPSGRGVGVALRLAF